MLLFARSVITDKVIRSVALLPALLGLLLAPASAAVLSVSNYGAAGNGSTDDTSAIQRAIDSSAAGDTIQFPAGTYKVSSVINVASNRTYQGFNAILKKSGGGVLISMPLDSAVNITLDGLTFDGGGITTNNFHETPAIQSDATIARNIRITNCTLQNLSHASTWQEHDALFSGGINGGVIAHNRFYNISDEGRFDAAERTANAVQVYRPSNLSITDNVFDTVNEGIGLGFMNSNGPFPGVVVARNIGTHVHRMGIEMQGSYSQGMIVDSNYFTNYLNPYWNTFGLSIVVDGGFDTVISNNMVDASVGTGYGYGIEISGTRTKVTGNTVRNGFAYGMEIGNAPYVTITGNYLCGPGNQSVIAWENGSKPGANISGNTTSSTCSATMPPPPAQIPAPSPTQTSAPPPPPAGGPLSNGVYAITDLTSSKFALDGGFFYYSKLTAMEVYPEVPANPLQQWNFTATGSGYTICSVGNGSSVCLSESGNTLIIGSAKKDIWVVTQSGAGYTLRNAGTGNYINDPLVSQGIVRTSTTSTIWSIHAPVLTASAPATVAPLANGTYAVTDLTSSKLALDGGFFYWSKLTAMEVYPEVSANNLQQWIFTASGSGYTICSVGNGSNVCLSESGNTLIIGSAKAIWTVAQSATGYTLRNAQTGNYINDPLVSQGVVRTSTTPTIWSVHSPR